MKKKITLSIQFLQAPFLLILVFLFISFSAVAQEWTVLGNEEEISAVASTYTDIALVENGSTFIPYAVFTEAGVGKVKKRLADGSWEQVGDDLATNVSFTRIHSNSIGELYVSYIDISNSRKLAVKKFDYIAETWNPLNDVADNLYASEGNVSEASSKFSGQRYSIAFDSFNVIYAAFSDTGLEPYVRKFNGTSWETVGATPIFGGIAVSLSLTFDAADKPWVVCSRLNGTGDTTGTMALFSFNGTVWEERVNPNPIAPVRQTRIANIDDNKLCIVSFDISNGNKATAVIYDKGADSWSSKTSLSSRDGQEISLIPDAEGNLYCSIVDKYEGSSYAQVARVRKLAVGTSTWTELENKLASRGVDEALGNLALAINNAPNPYIIYTKRNTNGENTPIVRTYVPPPPPAILFTHVPTAITPTTAKTGGNITSDGGNEITERGVVYSISNSKPTIEDSKETEGSGGIGDFTVNLTNLSPATFYYLRAYAINGGNASYGNTVRLSTLPEPDLPVTTAKQVEFLTRGLVAVQKSSNEVYLSWRLLGTDPKDISFNVYRNSVKINPNPITNSTNYVDNTTSNNNNYSIKPIINGEEGIETDLVYVWSKNQLSVPIQMPPSGTLPNGDIYTYTANDASVGDVDGDGIYEIVLKWQPTRVNDNAGGYSGKEIFDCYKLDGTRLWRIDLGINVNAGPHYNQFMVYDFDGDGKAEIILKTADGTIDGQGTVIGDATVDYRNFNGWVQEGPEFLTVFNGLTGAAMATTSYEPARANVSDWGDNYGNRQDRYVSAVAYLDGARPSLIAGRGYYNKLVRAAYDWRDGKLTLRWIFDSKDPAHPEYDAYSGQGNHQMTVGDVDGDGKDEIINGSSAINDDGTPLWTYGMGHGDALHMTDMDLDSPGQEIWINLESPGNYDGMGLRQYDAKTGRTNWGVATTGDVGRSMSADLDPNYKGNEMWGSSGAHVYDAKGNPISTNKPSYNFGIWWDGDLGREIYDRTYIDKWDYVNKWSSRLFTIYNAAPISSNNSTKSNPSLMADILGDWREEIIFRRSDNTALVIFTTDMPTEYRIPTLMHDPQYRTAIAWQNSAYNQPPNTSYYIGYDMDVNNIPTDKIVIAGESTLLVSDISRKSPASITTNANEVTFNINFTAEVTGVDLTDFTLTTIGDITGTIASINPVNESSYDVVLTNLTGEGTVRLDVKSTGTDIVDADGNQLKTGFTAGEVYTLDYTKPTLSIVSITSNATNLAYAKNGSTVTLSFTASEAITDIITTLAGQTVAATAVGENKYEATYELTDTDVEGIIPFNIQFKDLAGNDGVAVIQTSDESSVTYDRTNPKLVAVTLVSSNTNSAYAEAGDIVTLNFTASESIEMPVVTIAGQSVTVTNTATNQFEATYTALSTDTEGSIPFMINYKDLAGNTGPQISQAETDVVFRRMSPTITVYVETPSCPDKEDGSIRVATDMDSFIYTITVQGSGDAQVFSDVEMNTSTNWEKNNLAAGNYDITVEISSIDFKQSFGVMVNEISAVKAKRVQTKSNITYTVSGSTEYDITINGISKTYITESSKSSTIAIDNALLQETNKIVIATSSDCQGIVEDSFIISPSVTLYPNPTSDLVHINAVTTGIIQVYTATGSLLIERDAATTQTISLSDYDAGTYIFKIKQDAEVQTFKVILK
ncbi:T9SS type A sorting domain-containing protein [Leeuwenhoekiella sp. NPDC079379]|uniref:rhamnogalacturonan lyase family protein n=1 Tax=Leeuwenhoekiella sp. NPDC079379 TaxID=3364122 RepID=UPI0037CB321F